MKQLNHLKWKLLFFLGLALLAGCRETDLETEATAVPPTPTSPAMQATEVPITTSDRDFIVIATDAPNPPFTDFDKFGAVTGFNNAVMENIAAVADFDYEFVVTPHEGVLESVPVDFDAVMSTLIIPETPAETVTYTDPYLEVGQVLMVLADERVLQSHQDIRPGMTIGVQENSSSEETARDVLNINDADLFLYETEVQALQALVDEIVDAVIINSYSATYFTQTFPEQLKIAGGEGAEAWISSKAYGIAIAAGNSELLERLNQAIDQTKNNKIIERLTVAWLIPEETVDPGESRVGTPASELVIGVAGQLADMDPASDPDLMSWEVKNNTMGGLFTYNSVNELVPILAAGAPAISDDKLEYILNLRRGLRFPDGSEFTADDVKWSINRSARLGSFLVNNYLKDSDENNFADEDAVQIIDQFTVKIVLQEPTAYFLSLLATPPYFPISNECYGETFDPASVCGGIGPFTIVSWEPERMRLKANPEWPGRPSPAFENIQLRFYDDSANMLRSLVEFQSIDMAWTGLPFTDFGELRNADIDGDGNIDYKEWWGPATFKSYLIFEQSTPPWDSKQVRQAVAYAIDREELVGTVFGDSRRPLFSPIPDSVPGHLSVLPERDLGQSRALLLEAGYSESVPLEITIWYINDGRYTPLEEQYAVAIKTQLEETGVFLVTLSGAPWEAYRAQIDQCGYPAYLMGWPSPGRPTNYLDVTSWTDFFIQNTDSTFCSNYESATMAELVAAANEELDTATRLDLYAQIQQLWYDELPTLDLTQEPRYAISLTKVDNVRIDALGLLHYEVLTKGGG